MLQKEQIDSIQKLMNELDDKISDASKNGQIHKVKDLSNQAIGVCSA